MAIIPRFTSRALPPGAQPGLIKSAQRRGEAGAGLAKALGATIIAGVEFKKRKDLEAEAEAEAARRALEDRPNGQDGVPRPPIRPPYRASGKAADSSANLANKTDLEKQQSADIDRQSDETLLASFEATMTQIRAGAPTAVMKRGGPAKNMTRLALAEFDSEVAKLAEGLADRPQLKARFDALAASSRAPLELRVLRLENTRRVDEEKAGLADALAGLALAAGRDPAMAPGVSGRGLAQIEGAMKVGMLTPEDAAAMQQDFAAKVHVAAMRGQIAADPADAHARLEAGEFDDIFEAGARDRLTGEARTAARTRVAQALAAARARRRALEIDMAAHLEALAETGAGDEGLDARTHAELPLDEYAAFQASAADARERFATRIEYNFMTAAEIETDIAQQAPGGGPRDAPERAAAHAIRNETRDEILSARAADPAGWAMRDDDVAAAFAAAQADPDDPALARRAIQQRLALQREMAVQELRLLSEAERDEIADRLAQATPAERLDLIARLRERYGQNAGMLAAELAGEVDAATALLLENADMPHLPRLLANGMEKSAKDGPAALTLARPEDIDRLPALPILDRGEHGGRKLDMSGLKPGRHYRTADGDAVLYDGEALVPTKVDAATPDPADPNAPTPPIPLGKASPPSETAIKGIAFELDEQGDPVAVDTGATTSDDLEAELPVPPIGAADNEAGKASPQAGAEDKAQDEGGTAIMRPSPAEAQRRKQEAMARWQRQARWPSKKIPTGWKALPMADGRIDQRALEDEETYHVVGKNGASSVWRWNKEKRAFMPGLRRTPAFSIDGMHEMIGVQVRRTPDGRPIYNMEQDRINAIGWGIDAVFEVDDDTKDKGAPISTARDEIGVYVVNSHSELIEAAAKEAEISPNLIRAIMFVENSHGYYGALPEGIDEASKELFGFDPRFAKTILPMNINPETWRALGITRETASDPETNIQAGARLIREIQGRLENPSPRKVAALWHFMGVEKTDNAAVRNFVARVGNAVLDKPWESKAQPKAE